MSVGIVIITHGDAGKSLIRAAEFVLEQSLDEVCFLRFDQTGDHSSAEDDLRRVLDRAGSGNGVLVLTDLIGSSPSNFAADLLEEYDAVMVTGINLAMLISVWNYRDCALGLLVRKAVESGRRGVKIFQR